MNEIIEVTILSIIMLGNKVLRQLAKKAGRDIYNRIVVQKFKKNLFDPWLKQFPCHKKILVVCGFALKY